MVIGLKYCMCAVCTTLALLPIGLGGRHSPIFFIANVCPQLQSIASVYGPSKLHEQNRVSLKDHRVHGLPKHLAEGSSSQGHDGFGSSVPNDRQSAYRQCRIAILRESPAHEV